MNRLLILFIAVLINSQIHAAPRCETSLFGQRPEKAMDQITSQLNGHGYQMIGQNLFRIVAGQQQHVGTVEIIQPRFLFEWQEEEYHDAWVAHHGLGQDDMDYALSVQGQSYGRGFYVSLSPVDSMMYGSHLTIFENKEPLVILKQFNHLLQENEAVLNELRKIGFAGIRCTETWLNIFNEKYLQDAKRINKKILDQIYEPDNNVPVFKEARLTQQPSVNQILGVSLSLSRIFKKIGESGLVSPAEKVQLRTEFTNNSINFFRQLKNTKNETAILRATFNSLKIEDLLALGNYPVQSELQTYISEAFNKVPLAGAFFTLFDLFDVATIGQKKMVEPMKFSEMKSETVQYQKALSAKDLNSIKTVSDFTKFLEKSFKLDYIVRNYDVTNSSLQKGIDHITVASSFLNDLYKNRFLSVSKLSGFFAPSGQQKSVAEIKYFGLDQISQLRSLFTVAEYQKIQDLLGYRMTQLQQEKGIKYAISILLDKFFDPNQFQAIAQAMGENLTAVTLYKAFVSLQPYDVGNRRASDIYYRWLVANHFTKSNSILRSAMKEADLVQTEQQFTDTYAQNWNMMRLWVFSADSEKIMIERAKLVLLKDPLHFKYMQMIDDVSTLIQ